MAMDISPDLALALADVTEAIAAPADVDATLGRISRLAVLALDGCDHAGVAVRDGACCSARGTTGRVVEVADLLQHDLEEGPCVSAWPGGECYAPDLAADARWPRFGRSAAELGVASLLSFHLFPPADRSRPIGALHLYGTRVDAFSPRDRTVGVALAAHAGMTLAAAQTVSELHRSNVGLREALASRDVIGQAKGILMERHRVTADAAFDLLRAASQHLNVKLRAVAEEVAETGQLPRRPAR